MKPALPSIGPLCLACALALAWMMIGSAPAAAAPDNPGPWIAAPPQAFLVAGFWDMLDAFFMRYREWILTLGLIVVILGFALLYKSWK